MQKARRQPSWDVSFMLAIGAGRLEYILSCLRLATTMNVQQRLSICSCYQIVFACRSIHTAPFALCMSLPASILVLGRLTVHDISATRKHFTGFCWWTGCFQTDVVCTGALLNKLMKESHQLENDPGIARSCD